MSYTSIGLKHSGFPPSNTNLRPSRIEPPFLQWRLEAYRKALSSKAGEAPASHIGNRGAKPAISNTRWRRFQLLHPVLAQIASIAPGIGRFRVQDPESGTSDARNRDFCSRKRQREHATWNSTTLRPVTPSLLVSATKRAPTEADAPKGRETREGFSCCRNECSRPWPRPRRQPRRCGCHPGWCRTRDRALSPVRRASSQPWPSPRRRATRRCPW